MTPIAFRRTGALLACVLAVAGCSGVDRQAAAVGHDAGIRLVPDPATVNAQLAVALDEARVDRAECRFRWFRNEGPLAADTMSVLDPGMFHRGDYVRVEVTIPGRDGGPARVLRAGTTVTNAPPVVRGVHVVSDPSRGGATLEANVDLWDADGDATSCTYHWFRNGQMMTDQTSASLAATSFSPADLITVEVVASDRESKSEARLSEPFRIDNRAPRFAVEPPVISSEGNVLRVRTSALDPDRDPLSFELVQAPAGMTIGADGVIEWSLPDRDSRPAEIHVVVRVADGRGGEATQEFTVTLGDTASAVRPS